MFPLLCPYPTPRPQPQPQTEQPSWWWGVAFQQMWEVEASSRCGCRWPLLGGVLPQGSSGFCSTSVLPTGGKWRSGWQRVGTVILLAVLPPHMYTLSVLCHSHGLARKGLLGTEQVMGKLHQKTVSGTEPGPGAWRMGEGSQGVF